jgi:hypothetical protein
MLKAMATEADGKRVFIIGLSFANLDRFRAAPGDTFIRIRGDEVGLPVDVMIISGETEAHLARSLRIGPETEIRTNSDPEN